MTVGGGSGCLKELSIPAALLRREVKAICPTSKTKHTFMPSVSGPANRWRTSTVPSSTSERAALLMMSDTQRLLHVSMWRKDD